MDKPEINNMFSGYNTILQTFDLFQCQFLDEIGKAQFYFETLERLLSEEHSKTVLSFKKNVKKLTEAQQNYSFENSILLVWDEVFNSNLKSSFVISLFSLLEIHLKRLCKTIERVNNKEIRVKDFNGNFLARTNKYLIVCIGTSIKSIDWQTMEKIYKIRNIFAHKQGEYEQEIKNLKQFAEETDGINFRNGWIEISSSFCKRALFTVEKFGVDIGNLIKADLKDRSN